MDILSTKSNGTRGKRSRKLLAAVGIAASLLLGSAGFTVADDDTTTTNSGTANAVAAKSALVAEGLDKDGTVRMTVGKSTVVTTKSPYKRVSIGQPEVADVNPIGPGTILITAKKAGNTQLIVWDDADKSQVIDIAVEFDIKALQDQLKKMFPNANIEAASLNGAISLSGRVPNLAVAEQAVAVSTPFSQKVINLMEIGGGQQVMLQVRFAEVSRSASTSLGINGNYVNGQAVGGSNIGQVNPSSRLPGSGTVGVSPPFNGLILDGQTSVNPAVTLFGATQIGSFYLEYFIQSLRQNNLLRMLAEPNLIAVSGQEADFLAGGEFPIPVTQGGDGGSSVTVEYREFGVRLKFVPIVLGDGRIRLRVAPEVSDLDFTTAVRFNGFVIPGLTSRKISTTIELADGQSFAIAGLLNNSVTASKDVTPLLGDLPIIGSLFRSVRYQRKETELVVLVTPRLVEAMNPADVPSLPGEKWRHPSENDLFWHRDLGGEMADPTAPAGAATQPVAAMEPADAPRFRGLWGFQPATQPTSGETTSASTDADVGPFYND